MIEPNPYSERDIKVLLRDLKIRIDKINPLIMDINSLFSSLDCAINWDKKVQEMQIQDITNGINVNCFDDKTTATEYLNYCRYFMRNRLNMVRYDFEQNPTTKEDK